MYGYLLRGEKEDGEGQGVVNSDSGLLEKLRKMDPEWGIVEMSPADIAFPFQQVSHLQNYNTLWRILNSGARFISPMAASDGKYNEIFPAMTRSYDAGIGTDFHFHLLWWLMSWGDLPHGSIYHPFGNDEVSSADGWAPGKGTVMTLQKGQIVIQSQAQDGRVSIKCSSIGLAPLLLNATSMQFKGSFHTQQQANLTLKLASGLSSPALMTTAIPLPGLQSSEALKFGIQKIHPVAYGSRAITVALITLDLFCINPCILDEFRWRVLATA